MEGTIPRGEISSGTDKAGDYMRKATEVLLVYARRRYHVVRVAHVAAKGENAEMGCSEVAIKYLSSSGFSLSSMTL